MSAAPGSYAGSHAAKDQWFRWFAGMSEILRNLEIFEVQQKKINDINGSAPNCETA
jgi:hypothetical protein